MFGRKETPRTSRAVVLEDQVWEPRVFVINKYSISFLVIKSFLFPKRKKQQAVALFKTLLPWTDSWLSVQQTILPLLWYFRLRWPFERNTSTNCVKCARICLRMLAAALLSFQPAWVVSWPVSRRKGEFPERSWLFQPDQTLANCFVVCRVSVPVFVLCFSFV